MLSSIKVSLREEKGGWGGEESRLPEHSTVITQQTEPISDILESEYEIINTIFLASKAVIL